MAVKSGIPSNPVQENPNHRRLAVNDNSQNHSKPKTKVQQACECGWGQIKRNGPMRKWAANLCEESGEENREHSGQQE